MSRWTNDFNTSEFKKNWTSLRELADTLTADDPTVIPIVEELARLNKALAFLAGIIDSVDLELTPRSIWENCNSQTTQCADQLRGYESSRRKAHLTAANEHVDNLLTYVRPYMVHPAEALSAHRNAFQKFSLAMGEHLEEFQKRTAQTTTFLEEAHNYAAKQRKDADELLSQIKEFHNYLFDDSGTSEGAASAVKQRIKDINSQTADVQLLHAQLLEGPESISAVIKANEKKTTEIVVALAEMRSTTAVAHEALNEFHNRIFNTTIDTAGKTVVGLKEELETRFAQLDTFERAQATRHEAIFQKVESLLPGATSASLASAYKNLKDKFATPIRNYTYLFYASLALLLVCGLIVVTDTISLDPPSIQFVKGADWIEMLRTLLTRIPIIVPIVWVAIFSATRRSQYERLQQEYSHKEALTSSYDSFKKQLKDLGGDADELQKALISRAIDAIAYNASATLDGKHTEKLPALQILEKLNADELKKLLDLARGK